jgi:hypothetical protein
MATFRMTLNSTWSLVDLFDYMTTYSNAAEWDPGVTSGEALTTGAVGLHSEYRLLMAIGKREVPLTYRIVEFDRLRRVVLSAENKAVRSLVAIDVTPKPGGSQLDYQHSVTGLGPLAAAEPLIGITIRKTGARAEEQLRAKLAS